MLKKLFCAAAGLDLSRAEAVGSGRACQRPRTSSDAKCFSCEGALGGHALAVCISLLALLLSLRSNPLLAQTRSAPRNI